MKTKADLLRSVALQSKTAPNSAAGFTLLELLVVIIIIGILSAIALPSFLNQAAKAKQTEAKTYVGSVNRAQQAYRIEKSTFAADITSLEIGIPTQTTDYLYEINPPSDSESSIYATASDPTLKAYSGAVVVLQPTGQTAAGACQTVGIGNGSPPPDPPSPNTNGSMTCPAGMEPMR